MSAQAQSYGVDWAMEPLEGKDAGTVLKEAVSCIKGAYWLSAGTLLGIYRDGDFIPHDTDIDLAALPDTDINFPPEFELFRTVYEDSRLMQEAYIHRSENIIVDVLRYYPLDTYGHVIYNAGQTGRLFRPRTMILPTQTITFKGEEYKAPAEIESYLQIWYDEWEVPIRGGKTRWLK